jgi:hypothetical protein
VTSIVRYCVFPQVILESVLFSVRKDAEDEIGGSQCIAAHLNRNNSTSPIRCGLSNTLRATGKNQHWRKCPAEGSAGGSGLGVSARFSQAERPFKSRSGHAPDRALRIPGNRMNSSDFFHDAGSKPGALTGNILVIRASGFSMNTGLLTEPHFYRIVTYKMFELTPATATETAALPVPGQKSSNRCNTHATCKSPRQATSR